jgi:cold shock CspA family protein/tetratricopeptide (TPR) repeat protein
MTLAVPRLTLYALLSAIEEDMREVLRVHVAPQLDARDVLGGSADDVIARYERDWGPSPDPADLEPLLPYLDFPDAARLVSKERNRLPAPISLYWKRLAQDFERLVPIRNRVAHSRPLEYTDLPTATALAERLVSGERPELWASLRDVMTRLREQPSFVLGLTVPEFEDPVRHNLPPPDFDETGFLGRREQVNQLRKLLVGPYPVVTVFGDGGVGKTALALKAAYELLDAPDLPFDSIVWATSKTKTLTTSDITTIEGAITTSLGLISHLAQELAGVDSAEPVEEVLEYLREFNLLLVIDNLETVLDQRMREFLGNLPAGSKVLLTSRIGLGAFEYPMRLEPMADGDAIALMRALAEVRGVSGLTAMGNPRLAKFCRRLNNNPLWIKWFVAGAQAGRRPEELLAKPERFLDYALTNVYEYLSDDSRRVLAVMQSLGGRHSQAQLAYFTGLAYEVLQEALLELATTNMVKISSSPSGSSFESQYELGELARTYLSKHHPVAKDAHARLRKRRDELKAAGEELKAKQRSNPYLGKSLDMGSSGNLVVARHLLAAFDAIRDGAVERAEKEVESALQLAPEWFEVHRVAAFVEINRGNYPAAQDRFDAALELAPDAAPLRLWYALFLLDHLDDEEGGARELEAGLDIDPSAQDLRIELARAYLYLGEFDKARDALDAALDHQATLSGFKLRKLYDVNLQYFTRRADKLSVEGDPEGALRLLAQMKGAFQKYPAAFVDAKIRSRLNKSVLVSRRIERYAKTPRVRQQARSLEEWVLRESRAGAGLTELEQGWHEGAIARTVPERGFGFVRSEEGHELFFHIRDVAEVTDITELEPGRPVVFQVGEREDGKRAAVAVAPAEAAVED